MKSIRTFLILSVVATLILFNFIAAIQGYRSSMNEAEKLFDNKMLDTARLVANLHVEGQVSNIASDSTIAFQVWKNKQLIAASSNAPDEPISALQPGYGYINFNNKRWRSLGYFDRNQQVWITLAERADIRFLLAENVILKSVYPILLSIPVICLLIWLIIGHGLKPLRQLATELRDKRSDDLTAITTVGNTKELAQVTTSINSMLERLAATIEREKQFTADAAHELRTPISALKVQLYNIAHELPKDSIAFAQLQDGVDRMHHLVEQLLFFYRSSPEELAKNFTKIDLYALAQDVIAEQYAAFESKQQHIELDGSHLTVYGNTFGLTTLLQNLLSNANKYTPTGGHIKVSLTETPHTQRLIVEDSGPGIADEAHAHVFERFYRHASQSVTSKTPGCGLGLTIVRHIADLHNASVLIQASSFSTGCAFIVEFGRGRES